MFWLDLSEKLQIKQCLKIVTNEMLTLYCSTDTEAKDEERISDYLEQKRRSEILKKKRETTKKNSKNFMFQKFKIGDYEVIEKLSEMKSIEKYIGIKENSTKKYEITKIKAQKKWLSKVEHFSEYFRLYRNLENILDYFYFEDSVIYVFEDTETSLFYEYNEKFEKNMKFTFEELILISYEVVYGLYILHKKEWIYGNCSIKNIIKDLDGWKIKHISIINEFDTSEFPIEIEKESYLFSSDIFGIGIILLKLIICGQQEYKFIDKIDQIIIKEFKNNYKKSNNYTKEMKEFFSLILQMVDENPKKRPDSKTLYQKLFKFYSKLRIHQMEDFEFYQFLKLSEIPSYIRFYPIFSKISHVQLCDVLKNNENYVYYIDENLESVNQFDYVNKSIIKFPSVRYDSTKSSINSFSIFKNNYLILGKLDLNFYNLKTKKLQKIQFREDLNYIEIIEINSKILCFIATNNYQVHVYLIEELELKFIKTIETASNVNNICISPNKKYIAMATDSYGIIIYDSNTLERLFVLSPRIDEEKKESIFLIGEIQQQIMTLDCCSFNSTSNLICASGIRGAIIWDIKTQEIVHYIGNMIHIPVCKFSPVNPNILFFMGNGLHYYHLETKKYSYYQKYTFSSESGIEFSNDGKELFYSTGDEIFRINLNVDLYSIEDFEFTKRILSIDYYNDVIIFTQN
eukprot:gene11318-4130_t